MFVVRGPHAWSICAHVPERGVKRGGMRALFASVFSTMFGKARDVRDENRPAPHPPRPLILESETAGLVDLLQAGTTDFLVRRIPN